MAVAMEKDSVSIIKVRSVVLVVNDTTQAVVSCLTITARTRIQNYTVHNYRIRLISSISAARSTIILL